MKRNDQTAKNSFEPITHSAGRQYQTPPRRGMLKTLSVAGMSALLGGVALTPDIAEAGSAAMLGDTKLASNTSIGATSVTLNVHLGTLNATSTKGWIILDAFSSECEIRQITSVVGATVQFSLPLAYAHAVNDLVLFTDNPIYNVRLFGAKGDGPSATEDTLGIQRALSQAPTSGGVVLFPPGNYLLHSAIQIVKPVTLLGSGERSTILATTQATGDVLSVNTSGVHIRHLGFTAASGVTRTSGAYVNFTIHANQSSLEHFEMYKAFVGVNMASGATLYVEKGSIREISTASGSAGIKVSDGNDHYIRCVTMDNSADSQPSYGILISGTGCVNIIDCDIIHCTNDLHITGGASIYVVNCFFDTAVNGIWIESPNDLSPVVRCHFIGCWTSSHTGGGVTIINSGLVDTIEFIGHHSSFNGANGIHIMGGDNIKVASSSCSGNGQSGICVGPGAKHCIITGNRVGPTLGAGPNDWGVFIIGGADYLIVTNNDTTGNTHAPGIVGNTPNAIIANNFT